MFKRQWIWFGKLISDEGFSLQYGNKTVRYSDDRGSFEFGFEDGFLFSTPHQVAGEPVSLSQSELGAVLERIITGIKSDGHVVQVYEK
jgi:hypothetical protein